VIVPTRRSVLRGGLGVAAALVAGCAGAPPPAPAPPLPTPDPGPALADLERRQGRRIALVALDTGSGRGVRHRADERVLMCSTGRTGRPVRRRPHCPVMTHTIDATMAFVPA
jgi:beta-lactamase class A